MKKKRMIMIVAMVLVLVWREDVFCSGIWNDTGFATGRLAPRGRLPV